MSGANDRRAATEWEAMADVWLAGGGRSLWRAHSDRVNARLIARRLPGQLGDVLKTDLFDEAVGGGLVEALGTRATSVTGIDLVPDIIDAARRPGLEAVHADVRHLPFGDASFDTIFSNSTLDHFDAPAEIERALAELARVLRPGGRLLVTLDNPRNPVVALGKALSGHGLNGAWRTIGSLTSRLGHAPYYVGATLGAQELREALARAGLVTEWEGTLVHAPRALAVIVAGPFERRGADARRRFVRACGACERLDALPTRTFTAHFVAALAIRR